MNHKRLGRGTHAEGMSQTRNRPDIQWKRFPDGEAMLSRLVVVVMVSPSFEYFLPVGHHTAHGR